MAFGYNLYANSDAEISFSIVDRKEVVETLIREYPERAFCLLDVSHLLSRVKLIKNSFLPNDELGEVAYAVKANPSSRILNLLSCAGINHFDCASIEEIELISSLFPASRVLFNHPIKHVRDIREAMLRGVKIFTVQSLREIEKVLNAARGVVVPEIVVRIASHCRGARIPLSDKFGASLDSSLNMLEKVRGLPIKYGISIHVGSQNVDIKAHQKEIINILSIARQLGGVDSINVGGGMPVNYGAENQYCVGRYLKEISNTINEHAKGAFRGNGKRVYVEPGRAIVAESISLLIPVMACEVRNDKYCIYIDDGVFTSFSDSVVHNWRYEFQVVTHDGRSLSNSKVPMTVYGRTCDSGDKIDEVMLPGDIREGDYLFLRSAGAYMDAQSTRFNGFRPPQYVLYNM